MRGVFWVIDGKLFAVPFTGDTNIGVAKSGKNYNHRKLWEHVRPKGCNRVFDHYPRGRVEMNSRGEPILYMSPHVPEELLPEIVSAFGLTKKPKVRYDHSRHYRCYLDNT